jgi:hypothetical protein
MLEATPLQWPVGRPRTPINKRERARFHRRIDVESKYKPGTTYKQKTNTTVHQGLALIRKELSMLGATDITITTNLLTRLDGLPYASAREPDDCAAAAYFRLKSGVHCLACDRWDRLADNLCAIGHHIHAIRNQDRWGVGDVAAAFAGYRALPAMGASETWWAILGYTQPPSKLEVVRARYDELIYRAHPDRGGSANRAAEINAAFDEARKFYEKEG